MSQEQDLDLVHRIYAAVNQHDSNSLESYFAPDMVRHDLAGMLGESGSAGDVTNFLERLREAMPDLHMQVEDVLANDVGRVAARSTLSSTHKGEFLGAAPTDKRVVFAAITLYQIKEGRVAEAWSLVDWAGALRQMDVGSP
jgi:steroid delta-isomerase-like uncharacterized protein